VLTSHSAAELGEIGLGAEPRSEVLRLARLAQGAGMDGVVCSAQEAGALRETCGPQFCLVTPGIRPAGSAAGDQQRILTPRAALEQGSHYLVIGRPITQATDPVAALSAINAEIGA
jgi:orotidine-5'-phosphate decarboxylase